MPNQNYPVTPGTSPVHIPCGGYTSMVITTDAPCQIGDSSLTQAVDLTPSAPFKQNGADTAGGVTVDMWASIASGTANVGVQIE